MLAVEDLTVAFPSRFGIFRAIEDITLAIAPGEIHGLVGESGAGKSTIGAAIIGLLQPPGHVERGAMRLGETDLRALTPNQAHEIRGKRISMIFQDPQTSLNPLMTIEDQLIETILAHEDITADAARDRAVGILEEIGIRDARTRIRAYPHQFSGGMRQRVVIALAICTNPELVIADEPTTALDVAVQSQVLDLIRRLADDRGIGFLLITHDIGVIARITDRVTVLRAGAVMETGETAAVLGRPAHDYTRALMAAVPPLDRRVERFLVPGDSARGGAASETAARWLLDGDAGPPLGLSVEEVSVQFAGPRTSFLKKPDVFQALDRVSFAVAPGKVTGLVGESGSGKSTIAKVIAGLVRPVSGRLALGGEPLPEGRARPRRHPSRRLIQMIFQDPFSSLNARHRIGDILAEPLWLYGLEPRAEKRRALAAAMLDLVGMEPDAIDKYPHQFSGGQRQRIAVARALLARPRFLICDEPTSALDVSIQAQVLNLLKDLQARFGLSMLFITHNLAVVRQMADDLVVMRQGRIVDGGETERLFRDPASDYTRELIELTPVARF